SALIDIIQSVFARMCVSSHPRLGSAGAAGWLVQVPPLNSECVKRQRNGSRVAFCPLGRRTHTDIACLCIDRSRTVGPPRSRFIPCFSFLLTARLAPGHTGDFASRAGGRGLSEVLARVYKERRVRAYDGRG